MIKIKILHTFQTLGSVLSYCNANNITVKEIYENFWHEMLKVPNLNLSAFNMFEDLPFDSNVTIKTMRKITGADFKGQWKYVELLRRINTNLTIEKSKYDWSSSRPGSFLVKGLNIFKLKKRQEYVETKWGKQVRIKKRCMC